MPARRMATLLLLLVTPSGLWAGESGNRLAYLDAPCDPYYVGLETAKLVTPQWIGEPQVEAVVILSIDDLRIPERHERFLRPILQRLKEIDGRAPVSCMGNQIDVAHPQFAKWLAEGVTIEPHTYDHPCPCLYGSDFAKAKATYDRCVDQMFDVPNSRPVAFRMPCCDSMNSMSPRFYAEIFNKTTPRGNFLQINSSVFLLFTPQDPALPRSMVRDAAGRLRFDKYVPRDRGFVNYVEDYPYPYVVGRLCWELPSAIPDDWQGFNLQKAHSPATVADMKAAIDATCLKQGVFTLTHHAGVWIRSDQVIELIDHAVKQYGKKVKFLNFSEVQQRLNQNLLGGVPLRAPNGQDNGVRVLDVNGDGLMDVVIGNDKVRQTRIWSPQKRAWVTTGLPVPIVEVDGQGNRRPSGVRFGVLGADGHASLLIRNERLAGLWRFDGRRWVAVPEGLKGLDLDAPVHTSLAGRDQGVRLRDLDLDGTCELLVANPRQTGVFRWAGDRGQWEPLPFTLPGGTTIVDAAGRDAGLRLVDIDSDRHLDVVFSDAQRYSLHLFTSLQAGWSRKIHDSDRTQGNAIPPIVRADGTNNGAWFARRQMVVQNEDTGKSMPNHIQRRAYAELLADDSEPTARSPEAREVR